MNVEIILQLLLSLWLGALIWMERGVMANNDGEKTSSFWEIRTFSLISLFWALSAWLTLVLNNWLFIVFWFIAVFIFIAVYYIYLAFKEKRLGLTTEFSALITFFLWVFVIIWFYQIAIIISVILTFVLSSKANVESIISKISVEWLNNTIKFAMISVVVLPLLPDQKYSLAQILEFLGYNWEINNAILNLSFFNPYGLWLFVVLMSGISYAGYIMSKIIWEKGSIVASGAIGWLISSTAVTASMSEASKKDKRNIDMYVVSTLLASTIMFVRVILIVLFFNINMLTTIIWPSLFMLIWMSVYMIFFYLKSRKKDLANKNLEFEEKKYSSPFSIWPALKFAWFVLIIKFISALWSLYQDVWWDYFFYALWVISGLADVDAVSQTMAVDALDWKVGITVASITIIIAIISNNFVKWGIAYKFWEKKFWKCVMLWFVISMIMGILWMWVIYLA